jgi:two-component system phosphate regulon response regulator OmpR
MATILVVDDDPIVRDVVVRYLERDGHRTLVAGDGNHADELLRKEALDLVVLDVMLPGRDGLALSRSIRSRLVPPDHPPDRARRGGRPDRRPRARSGRLRHEAVLAAGARGTGSGAATAGVDATRPARRPLLRRRRARRGCTRGPKGRRRGRADGEGVRSPLVPRLPPEAGLLARPAHDERLGVRARARDRHRDGPRQALRRKVEADPARPRHLQTVWGVGYRLVP